MDTIGFSLCPIVLKCFFLALLSVMVSICNDSERKRILAEVEYLINVRWNANSNWMRKPLIMANMVNRQANGSIED